MHKARPWVRGDLNHPLDHPSCIPIYLGRTMLCSLPVRATPGGHARLSNGEWITVIFPSTSPLIFLPWLGRCWPTGKFWQLCGPWSWHPAGWGYCTWEINCSFFPPKRHRPPPTVTNGLYSPCISGEALVFRWKHHQWGCRQWGSRGNWSH